MSDSSSPATTLADDHTTAIQHSLTGRGGLWAVTVPFGAYASCSDIRAGRLVRDTENTINRQLLGAQHLKPSNKPLRIQIEWVLEDVDTEEPVIRGLMRVPMGFRSRMRERFEMHVDPDSGAIWRKVNVKSKEFPRATGVLEPLQDRPRAWGIISRFVMGYCDRYGHGPDLITPL